MGYIGIKSFRKKKCIQVSLFPFNAIKQTSKTDIWFQTIDSFLPQQFERDLRRFARLERRMLLDNHALYDKTKVLSAT